jgi:hypothetical protein
VHEQCRPWAQQYWQQLRGGRGGQSISSRGSQARAAVGFCAGGFDSFTGRSGGVALWGGLRCMLGQCILYRCAARHRIRLLGIGRCRAAVLRVDMRVLAWACRELWACPSMCSWGLTAAQRLARHVADVVANGQLLQLSDVLPTIVTVLVVPCSFVLMRATHGFRWMHIAADLCAVLCCAVCLSPQTASAMRLPCPPPQVLVRTGALLPALVMPSAQHLALRQQPVSVGSNNLLGGC